MKNTALHMARNKSFKFVTYGICYLQMTRCLNAYVCSYNVPLMLTALNVNMPTAIIQEANVNYQHFIIIIITCI